MKDNSIFQGEYVTISKNKNSGSFPRRFHGKQKKKSKIVIWNIISHFTLIWIAVQQPLWQKF